MITPQQILSCLLEELNSTTSQLFQTITLGSDFQHIESTFESFLLTLFTCFEPRAVTKMTESLNNRHIQKVQVGETLTFFVKTLFHTKIASTSVLTDETYRNKAQLFCDHMLFSQQHQQCKKVIYYLCGPSCEGEMCDIIDKESHMEIINCDGIHCIGTHTHKLISRREACFASLYHTSKCVTMNEIQSIYHSSEREIDREFMSRIFRFMNSRIVGIAPLKKVDNLTYSDYFHSITNLPNIFFVIRQNLFTTLSSRFNNEFTQDRLNFVCRCIEKFVNKLVFCRNVALYASHLGMNCLNTSISSDRIGAYDMMFGDSFQSYTSKASNVTEAMYIKEIRTNYAFAYLMIHRTNQYFIESLRPQNFTCEVSEVLKTPSKINNDEIQNLFVSRTMVAPQSSHESEFLIDTFPEMKTMVEDIIADLQFDSLSSYRYVPNSIRVILPNEHHNFIPTLHPKEQNRNFLVVPLDTFKSKPSTIDSI